MGVTGGSFWWCLGQEHYEKRCFIAQRRYHLSYLAEEETEDRRNENCIVNSVIFGTEAGSMYFREEAACVGRTLHPCPAEHAVWAAAFSICG